MTESSAYIALGSNVGDRAGFLQQALRKIDKTEGITITGTSSIYETDPVGYTDQGRFLNMAIQVVTDLTPFQLLDRLLQIEQESGRTRDVRWGPRTLDLDILLYNQENIETERLIIPHPRMTGRAFVMIPLVEIDPNVRIPAIEQSLPALIDELPDKEGVHIWKQKNGAAEYGLFES